MLEPKPRKQRTPYQPPAACSRLYLRLAPKHLAMLKFLLEGWGHLGILSVVDRHAAVAKLTYSPDSEADMAEFLRQAAPLTPFEIVYRPER